MVEKVNKEIDAIEKETETTKTNPLFIKDSVISLI